MPSASVSLLSRRVRLKLTQFRDMVAPMSVNAWGIKLGSGGSAVDFCEERGVVGVGWRDVDINVAKRNDREFLKMHLSAVYGEDYPAVWPGTLLRFVSWCQPGDFIIYYVPKRKSFVIVEVVSDAYKRDTSLDDETDIWMTRDVAIRMTIPSVDFYAPLKGRVLGPRMSFWQIHGEGATVDALASGRDPLLEEAPDPVIVGHLEELRKLATTRLHSLDAKEYELAAADYFRFQGAEIIGEVGADAIIDVHARFDRGSLGPDDWLVQVKRYQDAEVDVSQIEELAAHTQGSGQPCFVSAFGFTEMARQSADELGVILLETSDFVPLALSGRMRPELARKVTIPGWTSL